MLFKKLYPITDKFKDWLMGQWIEKHGNHALYIFISLSFKWGIQDKAIRFFCLAFWQVFDALVSLSFHILSIGL